MSTERLAGKTPRDSREGSVSRRRIASTLLVVAIAGLVVTTVIAYQDRVARQEAERQRDVARSMLNEISCSHKKAMGEAERQRATALQRLSQVEESLRKQNSGLEKELQRLKAIETSRIAEVVRLTTDSQRLKARLRGLETQDETASRRPEGALESQECPSPSPAEDTVQGIILLVSPRSNLVALNVGRLQGIAVGDEFLVVRADAIVAKLAVESVDGDTLSLARVVAPYTKDDLKSGDAVQSVK